MRVRIRSFAMGKPRFIRELPKNPQDAVLEFLRVMGPTHRRELTYWIRGAGKAIEVLLTEGVIVALKGEYYGLPGDEKWWIPSS